ncbi:MAG: sortase [Acidimicrobiales bacterium]
MFVRVLGGIGRTLIAAGVIILLFTGYQLWGTGIQHARAQSALDADFFEALEQANTTLATPAPTAEPTSAPSGEPNGEPEPEPDPFELTLSTLQSDFDAAGIGFESMSPELVELLSLLYPDAGEALLRITIPAIGVDETVVEGVGVEDLRKGPGHYSTTPLPGQDGNAAIAGHRTTYGAPFHDIDQLEPGDEIVVQTIQGTFTYEVMAQESADGTQKGHLIVPPSATEVLRDFGDDRLTLTACHPKYSARQRIIVHAELVGEPVVTFPRPGQVTVADQTEPPEIASEFDDGGDDDGSATAGADADSTTGDPAAPDGPAGDGSASSAGDPGDGETGDAGDDTFVISQTPVSSEGFGSGLGGDLGAIPPAASWAVAAGSIWLAAWFVGRRWRRWPSYALGIVPFLVVLFFSFEQVDRALPAY